MLASRSQFFASHVVGHRIPMSSGRGCQWFHDFTSGLNFTGKWWRWCRATLVGCFSGGGKVLPNRGAPLIEELIYNGRKCR